MKSQGLARACFLVFSLVCTDVCAVQKSQLDNHFGSGLQNKPSAIDESNIASDEVLQFFTSDAYQSDVDDDGSYTWLIPVHAWVYEPVESKFRMKLVRESLALTFDLEVEQENLPLFEQRVNQFLVDNERGKWFTLQLGATKAADAIALFRVGETDVNGHVLEQLSVDSSIVENTLSPALTSISYCTSVNAVEVCGRARLIPQQGLSVISDIDDTVKISEVRSKKALIENTFVHPFKAVPSIAQKYSAWAEQGVSFHYVSSSPWYLYTELTSFLEQSGFPDFSLSLKSFRFRDESLLALFKDGEETKPRQIRQVIEKYPRRQFVLIGDSGEQDPEVYTAIKLEYPNQILAIYIRDLGLGDTNQARIHQLVERMEGFPIVLFKDAAELPTTLSTKN